MLSYAFHRLLLFILLSTLSSFSPSRSPSAHRFASLFTHLRPTSHLSFHRLLPNLSATPKPSTVVLKSWRANGDANLRNYGVSFATALFSLPVHLNLFANLIYLCCRPSIVTSGVLMYLTYQSNPEAAFSSLPLNRSLHLFHTVFFFILHPNALLKKWVLERIQEH